MTEYTKEQLKNLGFFIFILIIVAVVSYFIITFREDIIKQDKNYTLVNYTTNGDTIAVYNNIRQYYFMQPSIVIIFEDCSEVVVSGNYTLFDKSKR